jgi:serine kinase of HPr protein (carbohydrate metabolism regulator)
MVGAVNLHASCVAFGEDAVLIQGEPGSGKSTLALELIETAGNGLGVEVMRARLVSDDRTLVRQVDGMLMASVPENLSGKIEVRGLGILEVPDTQRSARLALVILLQPKASRMPDTAQTVQILDVKLPLVVFPSESGALPSRVRAAFLRVKSAVAHGQ